MTIQLTSPAFHDNHPIPVKYTQDGDNLSPPLQWSNLPPGTQALALVCQDPDAPRPQPFVHWVAFNIPPNATGLPEGLPQKPKLITPLKFLQGQNDQHDPGYDGPAPPPGHGTHHYHFHLYALDRPLQLQPHSDLQSLFASMKGHILADTELIATYERPH